MFRKELPKHNWVTMYNLPDDIVLEDRPCARLILRKDSDYEFCTECGAVRPLVIGDMELSITSWEKKDPKEVLAFGPYCKWPYLGRVLEAL